MDHDVFSFTLSEDEISLARRAAALPLTSEIMFLALDLFAKRKSRPLEARVAAMYGSLVRRGVDVETAIRKTEGSLPKFQDSHGEILKLAALGAVLRMEALHQWRRARYEMIPVLESLMDASEGARIFGDYLGSATLELAAGRPPIFEADLSTYIREGLVFAGKPMILFVEVERLPQDEVIAGIGMTVDELVTIINSNRPIPRIFAALLMSGYHDPYSDLKYENQEEFFLNVQNALDQIMGGRRDDLQSYERGELMGMLLAHLARSQAVAREVGREPIMPKTAEEMTSYLDRPLKIADDGMTFVFAEPVRTGTKRAGTKETRNGMAGAPPAPSSGEVSSKERREMMSKSKALKVGDAFGGNGAGLPEELVDLVMDKFQDRMRTSLGRISRADAKSYLATLGWELDIEDLEADENARHLDLLGFLQGRPVRLYAAMTAPLAGEDTVLTAAVSELEEELDERPILLALQPLFQVAAENESGAVERVVIQGGWAYDGHWRPFAFSKQSTCPFDPIDCEISEDVPSRAFFDRHGHGGEVMQAIAGLAVMRYRALPTELRPLFKDPEEQKPEVISTKSGWMGFAALEASLRNEPDEE